VPIQIPAEKKKIWKGSQNENVFVKPFNNVTTRRKTTKRKWSSRKMYIEKENRRRSHG
jgi:hypothetical protein